MHNQNMLVNDIITRASNKLRKYTDDAQFRTIIGNYLFSINTEKQFP